MLLNSKNTNSPIQIFGNSGEGGGGGVGGEDGYCWHDHVIAALSSKSWKRDKLQ